MPLRPKVFVTGAGGMLGLSICKELIKRNYEVKGVVLPGKVLEDISRLGIKIARGDILDQDFIEREISDCQYVIHAAALTTVWPRRSESIKKTNVEGTRVIAEAAERNGIKRFIHIGSASSFNHGTLQNPGTEMNEYDGWKYQMDYIDSKYLAQKLLLEKFFRKGFPVIVINPTYIIGPFDSGPSSGKMLIELINDNLPGFSPGGKNFVCSCDVAAAAVNALEMGKPGECYIIGNENLSYRDFFRKVCMVSNKKWRLTGFPVFLILLIGFLNSVSARIFSVHPKLSYSMARFSCVKQFYSSQKARKELQVPATPIEEGIKSSLEWFISNGYLKKHD